MSELDWTDLPGIVSADSLAERLRQGDSVADGRLVLADVRWDLGGGSRREEYFEEHLPGAIFVDLDRDLTGDDVPGGGRHPFPTDDDFGDTLGELGIEFEDTVVAYGKSDPISAARFVVMLRLSGVNAAVLDGGIEAWKRAGGEVDSGEVVPEPVVFGSQPFVRLVDIDEVAHAIPSKGALLIDARPHERFTGQAEPLDPRAGHIPGARNVPYTENLNQDGTFRSVGELRQNFESRGATTPRIIFNYCGSGVSACVNMLALDSAGFEHAYLFPGSYSQWSRNAEREVETGD